LGGGTKLKIQRRKKCFPDDWFGGKKKKQKENAPWRLLGQRDLAQSDSYWVSVQGEKMKKNMRGLHNRPRLKGNSSVKIDYTQTKGEEYMGDGEREGEYLKLAVLSETNCWSVRVSLHNPGMKSDCTSYGTLGQIRVYDKIHDTGEQGVRTKKRIGKTWGNRRSLGFKGGKEKLRELHLESKAGVRKEGVSIKVGGVKNKRMVQRMSGTRWSLDKKREYKYQLCHGRRGKGGNTADQKHPFTASVTQGRRTDEYENRVRPQKKEKESRFDMVSGGRGERPVDLVEGNRGGRGK